MKTELKKNHPSFKGAKRNIKKTTRVIEANATNVLKKENHYEIVAKSF
ncbi:MULTISPECIES: hypothetical protein [unclassified Bartonella]